MAKKVYNMQGGKHSAAALSAFLNAMYGSSVASGLSGVITGTTGLNTIVKAGAGNINDSGVGRMIEIDADETVSHAAASPSNPRYDLVVAYIDKAVTPTASVVDNVNNILKFKSVTGNPSSNPIDPIASEIQASVGASNPYMILYRVRIEANATSLTQDKIIDLRKLVSPPLTSSMIADSAITTAKLANNSVIAPKIDFASLAFGNYSLNEVDTGFTWVDGKAIYKKTINFGALPNNTIKNVAHGISNLDFVISAGGSADNGSGGARAIIPVPSPENIAWGLGLEVNNTHVRIITKDNYSSRTRCYITIVYVKS